MKIHEIILASTSQFRKKILEASGLSFRCISPFVNEYDFVASTAAAQASLRALKKAESVALRYPDSLVIGSDQTLSFGDIILDKVSNRGDAKKRLKEFAGKTHTLTSSYVICVQKPSQETAKASSTPTIVTLFDEYKTATIRMRDLTDAEIDAYCENSYEWQGTTGAYQYENLGMSLWEEAIGDHFTILGVPANPLLANLRQLGINPLLKPTGPWEIQITSR